MNKKVGKPKYVAFVDPQLEKSFEVLQKGDNKSKQLYKFMKSDMLE